MSYREVEYRTKAQFNPKFFDGFITELKKVDDTQMAIVSTAYQALLEKAVADIEMADKFSHVCGFRANFSKERCVEDICQDWRVDLDQVYFFTDTLRDIIEMKNTLPHNRIIGCGWGWHGPVRLSEELPKKQILETFEDFTRFLDQNDSQLRGTPIEVSTLE